MAKLSGALIRKHHGNLRAAWAEKRRDGGGKSHRGRHNPHRRMPPRTASGRFRKRRNPTGHPLSGSSYRPRFRVGRSGIRHGPRFAAVPQRRRLRRARVHHHARRVRHNPARRKSGRRSHIRRRRRGSVGYGSMRGLSLSRTGAKGAIQRYVPLTTAASRHSIRVHKGHAIVGAVGGLLVTSVMASAGGTVTGVLVTVGGGIILRLASKHSDSNRGQKWEAVAAGFVVGGLIAVGLNMLAGGSLTGTAKLGATMTNLKRLAARVKMHGLRGLGDASSQGLFGKPLTAIQAGLAKHGIKLPALSGKKLGDYFNGETYNPVTEVGLGLRGGQMGRNAQGWGVPGTTGF